MRKALLAATLVLCLAGLGMAQSKDNKYEVFAGFSVDSINTDWEIAGLPVPRIETQDWASKLRPPAF